MQVLTHELGHAFAGYMAMRSQPISDYYSESTDIAEIHSMSMEQFAYPYAEWFFGDQADKFRFAHLQEALTFVPFGVAVDEFQHTVSYTHLDVYKRQAWNTWGGRGSQDVRKGIRIERKPLKTAKKCRKNIAVVLCLLRRSFCAG